MRVLRAPVMAGVAGILGVAGRRDQTLFVDFQGNRVVLADDPQVYDTLVRFAFANVKVNP